MFFRLYFPGPPIVTIISFVTLGLVGFPYPIKGITLHCVGDILTPSRATTGCGIQLARHTPTHSEQPWQETLIIYSLHCC